MISLPFFLIFSRPLDMLIARHIASFSDVEVFDPQIAQTLRVILVSDVTDFYMDFSDVGMYETLFMIE